MTSKGGFLLTLWLAVFLLTACAANPAGDSVNDPGNIPNDEGGALLIEATQAAERVMRERRTATVQAATMSAGATRDFGERAATGTAQALNVRQQEMDLNATSNARAMEYAATREAATSTAIDNARRNAATATGEALQATSTADAATATRAVQAIAQQLAEELATATSEALAIKRAQAQVDAARAQAWADFFDSLLKIILGLGGLSFLFMLIIQFARYLDALALRQKLIETRSGTVLIIASRNGYSAEIIKPTPNILDEGNTFEFEPSQAGSLQHEVPELLKINTVYGQSFIAKDDPEAEQHEINRRLALRLVRESIRHYSARGFEAREVNRLASQRDLNWSPETWVRAVNLLKPHVITKPGRGGGTFCGPQYPNLLALYTALGERRLALTVAKEASPSPTEVAVAA